MNDKVREELIRRSVKLDAISKHPEFRELLAENERRLERDRRKLAADLVMMGKPVDQREIDYMRGWWDCQEWQFGVLDKAKDTLERALGEAKRKDN